MEDDNKKELNLTDVLSIFGKWILSCIRACWNFVVWCLRCLFRHKWVTLICCCVAIAGSVLYVKYIKPFKSGFYLTSYIKSSYYPIEITNSIGNLLLQPGNAFAEELGLDSVTASAIKKMKAYYVVDIKGDGTPDFADYRKRYAKDTLINIWSQKFLYVELLSKNRSVVPTVKDSLIKKLNTYPILHDAWAITQQTYTQWVLSYEKEIAQYDSVQAKMYRNIGEQKGYSLSNGTDGLRLLGEERVQIFQAERQQLMSQILDIKQQQKEWSYGPVNLTLPIIYKEKSLAKNTILFLFVAIVLEIAVLYIAENRKKLKKFLQPSSGKQPE